jgi:hypothetical protein
MTAKCKIVVPKGVQGQVVYGKESSRGGQDWALEEGGTVRENQVLIRLPNPKKMEVKALINEQSITQIEPGMPVKIRVDALNNRELTGRVTKVNQYAEQNGWMASSVRKYAVFIRIFNPPETLKTGMNTSVSIQSKYKNDALIAPVQSVYGVQGKQYCLIKKGENQWETREVKTEGENAENVLISDGLQEGEVLVLNPGAYKEYMDLPELKLVKKIEVGDGQADVEAVASKPAATPTEGPPRGAGGGMGDFKLPASASALLKEKDKDADGKLSKDEIGSPYTFFFDRIDSDGDSLLNDSELDAAIKMMRQMRASRGAGGPGGPPGAGGPPAAGGPSQ